jgi:hypothetical protein
MPLKSKSWPSSARDARRKSYVNPGPSWLGYMAGTWLHFASTCRSVGYSALILSEAFYKAGAGGSKSESGDGECQPHTSRPYSACRRSSSLVSTAFHVDNPKAHGVRPCHALVVIGLRILFGTLTWRYSRQLNFVISFQNLYKIVGFCSFLRQYRLTLTNFIYTKCLEPLLTALTLLPSRGRLPSTLGVCH